MRLIFAILFACCAHAWSQLPADIHRESMYERGIAALNSGKVPDALVLCTLDDYKDAKARCADAKLGMKALAEVHNSRFTSGVTAMNQGRLADAERLLASVKYGKFVTEARETLRHVRELKQKKIAAGEEPEPASDEIGEMSKRWRSAFLQADSEALKSLESDDFTIIRSGDLLDKYRHLEEVSGRGRLQRWYGELDRQMQVINPNLVVIYGRAFRRSDVKETSYPSGIQVTEVWARKNGKWQITHVHDSTFTTRIIR